MTIYVVERAVPRDPRNYATFWDSDNGFFPDGSVNFQTREYPSGYIPQDLPPEAQWLPIQGSVWPGAIPAPYVEPSAEPEPEAATEPEPTPEPEPIIEPESLPEPPAIDPFNLPDEELEKLLSE
jgi:hypothetical protein